VSFSSSRSWRLEQPALDRTDNQYLAEPMHHYGEEAVKVELNEKQFTIFIINHDTNATIRVSGPVQGVMETRGKLVDRNIAETFGREIAHVARRMLI
jgi:hypothetical protein